MWIEISLDTAIEVCRTLGDKPKVALLFGGGIYDKYLLAFNKLKRFDVDETAKVILDSNDLLNIAEQLK